MNLVNWQGSAIFGPGSEWFWAMAQFLLVAVTLIGIYYQLRVARNANAFAQLDRITTEGQSERMCRNMLEIELALRGGVNPENIPTGPASFVADFWDAVGALVRAGHIDRRLVYEALGSSCQWWWAALAPESRRYRRETGDLTGGMHFEWLAGVMAKMSRKAGMDHRFDDAYVAATLDRRIEMLRDKIRVAEELRTLVTSPMSSALPWAQPNPAQADTSAAGS